MTADTSPRVTPVRIKSSAPEGTENEKSQKNFAGKIGELMKAELGIPPELVTAIAQAVAGELKPLLVSRKAITQDAILTPKQLADYLQTSRQWVYERVSLGEIPYTKVGKYLRFRKSVIDKWIETQSIPVSNPLSRSLKTIK